MTIRQVITFRVKKGEGAAFARGFAPIVDAVRKVDGCEQYDLFVSREHPDTLLMLERWRDLASLEGALKRHARGPDAPSTSFLELLDGPPVRERYEV